MAAKFSPSDAALSVFSFARSNQAFTLKYMLFFAIVTLATSSILAFSGFFEYTQFMNEISQKGQPPSMQDYEEAIALINPLILFLAVLFSFFMGMIISAIGLRKTVLNKDTGPQFGTDEKNLMMGGLGIGLIMTGVFFAAFIIIAILGAVFSSSTALTALVSTIGFVFMLLALVFVNGRYGQFGVFAIADKNYGLKASFQYTKDGFWSFIGAYVLGGVILMILSIIITQAFSLIINALLPDALYSTPPKGVADFFKIGNIIFQFLSGSVAGFLNLGFICIGAYIFHQQPNANLKSEINTNGDVV